MSRHLTIVLAGFFVIFSIVSPPSRAEQSLDAPVKRIDVYILPFYQAATTAYDHPIVSVSKYYDNLLTSNNPQDIVLVSNSIMSNPGTVAPTTLMVLAIRLYDVGLRDQAVFWFYAAKYRYATLSAVLDLNAPSVREYQYTMGSFNALVGPFINSYAFCDFANQHNLALKALDWVENNPYKVVFMNNFVAKVGDRHANLYKSIEEIRIQIQKELEMANDSEFITKINNARIANHVIEQFCWK